MDISFNKQVVLLTGATSGIGQAAAVNFAKHRANLMLTGRNRDRLVQLKNELALHNEKIEFVSGDITNSEFREHLVKKTIEKFGRLDVLVNAAGIIATGTIEDTTLDNFDYMMDLNLRSVFHLMQISIPYLKVKRGNIVNVSSVTGIRAFPGVLAYSVSKAGVDQLTHCAALELASCGVRVNAVNPGVVRTNLHRRGGMDADTYANFLEHSKTSHPLGRVGEPEEVADLILFLASDHAKWITGGSYSIDGGRHQTCAR